MAVGAAAAGATADVGAVGVGDAAGAEVIDWVVLTWTAETRHRLRVVRLVAGVARSLVWRLFHFPSSVRGWASREVQLERLRFRRRQVALRARL